MKVLLTGATGFLGSHLLERLVDCNNSVVCLKRESSNLQRVEHLVEQVEWFNLEGFDYDQFFLKEEIDCIIHCATHYGRKEEDPLQTIEANIILPLKLLYASSKTNISMFINTDTILDKRINHYSLSKNQFVDWLRSFPKHLTLVNLAIEHFYGPLDDESKFVSFIVKELITNERKTINLTEGLQKRDFIYIDDVVEAFMVLLRNMHALDKSFHHFEVGSNNPISIKEFVTLTKELCKNNQSKLNFGAIPYRKNEIMLSSADTSLLESLGWAPRVNLIEGLKKTINN